MLAGLAPTARPSRRITVNWGEPKFDIWRLAFEVVM